MDKFDVYIDESVIGGINGDSRNKAPNGGNYRPGKSHNGRTAAILVAVCLILSVASFAVGTLFGQVPGNTPPTDNGDISQNKPNTIVQSTPAVIVSKENLVSAVKEQQKGDLTVLSVEEIVEKIASSVVEISTETVTQYSGRNGGQTIASGAGSGVIFDFDDKDNIVYVITNNHVIEGVTNICLYLRDGTKYDASLIATDASADIAVLSFSVADDFVPTIATFGDSDSLKVGELAVVIGNPLGALGGSVTSGIISATKRTVTIEDNMMTLIQTDAAVNPGNSGGGLFNKYGQLIGIINAKSYGSEIDGLGFAIPSNTAKSNAYDLLSYGFITGRPYLGVELSEITDAYSKFMYKVDEYGLYIATTNKDLGVVTGDYIKSFDGQTVDTFAYFKYLVSLKKPGDTVKLIVSRDGKDVELNITVSEYRPQT